MTHLAASVDGKFHAARIGDATGNRQAAPRVDTRRRTSATIARRRDSAVLDMAQLSRRFFPLS